MRKTVNRETIEGYLYEHNLSLKTVQNTESANFGKEFINGTIDIATDDACTNIIQVHYSYVTATTKVGKPNATYSTLKNVIDAGKSVLVDGVENATKLRLNPSLDLNDFYTTRDGEEVLVSAKRNEGGFAHTVTGLLSTEDKRNTFEYDMLITGTNLVEADEERNIAKDYLELKGYVFNFKNDFLPVTLTVKDEGGMKYFDGLEASDKQPVFTKVRGSIVCENIVTKKEEESAWGAPVVKESTRTIKQWLVTWSAPEPYELGEDNLTGEEFKAGLQNRETYLADVKRRSDEYQATKNAGTASTTGKTAAAGAFNF